MQVMSVSTQAKSKTRAEIQRNYRERKKAQNCEAYLAKERQRWHCRRNEKKVKVVSDLTAREKRRVRKDWCERQRRGRLQRKNAEAYSPADSSDDRCPRGRPLKRRADAKSYRKIVKLQQDICAEKRAKDRYRKKFERLKRGQNSRPTPIISGETPCLTAETPHVSHETPRSKTRKLLRRSVVSPSVRKTLIFHNALLDEINNSVSNLKTEKHKRMASKLVQGGVLKRSRVKWLARKAGIKVSKTSNIDLDNSSRCPRSDAVDSETSQLVKDFYNRDDNSRLTSGKKDFVTKNKLREQKRLLTDTVKNLHDKFCGENPHNAVSYPTFTRLRPFWVLAAQAKDRQTCLCKMHDNVQLKAEKLFQMKMLPTRNAEEILQQLTCDVNRECAVCKDKSISFLPTSGTMDAITVWSEWVTEAQTYEKKGQTLTSKKTVKRIQKGTVEDLKQQFLAAMQKFAGHVYNIRHQFRKYRDLKRSLSEKDAVIHIDFSENWNCKYSAEIQSVHFGGSQQQASLHTGVVYTLEGHWSFATISPVLLHGPQAIWAHLDPILSELKKAQPTIDVLHFYSDGPTTQYKNKLNFYFFSTRVFDFGFRYATWNFFEAGHGKGAPDAVGGCIKRTADRMVLNGADIPDASSLYNTLRTSESAVKVYYVDEEDVLKVNCPKSLSPIKGTMKLHQLWTSSRKNIAHRSLSCFCCQPKQCPCFELAHSNFHQCGKSTRETGGRVGRSESSADCADDVLAQPTDTDETSSIIHLVPRADDDEPEPIPKETGYTCLETADLQMVSTEVVPPPVPLVATDVSLETTHLQVISAAPDTLRPVSSNTADSEVTPLSVEVRPTVFYGSRSRHPMSKRMIENACIERGHSKRERRKPVRFDN